jgi:hypothetical protein
VESSLKNYPILGKTMSETQDWNSGQGAYPSDRDTWTLTMFDPHRTHSVVRHLSSKPKRDEIRSLCDDEMGDIEREVNVEWHLEDPDGNETRGRMTLKPTGGAS